MSDDGKNTKKITGYLERRGKLKLMNSWKRYWYVLEGHLLLYYGSKEEYDGLSPCKGSLTLGPTCSVKPYPSTTHKFQITTRSGNVVTLRAESILEQNKWMQAICTTLNENQKVDISPTKLCHFRYSTESVDSLVNSSEQPKPNTTPTDGGSSSSEATSEKEDGHLLERLQRMGARSYAEDIVTSHQMIVNKKPKLKKLELSEKVLKKKEGGLHSPKVLQYSPKIPKISEEPVESTGEEIVLEEEDYCVCLLEKNEDSNTPKKIQPRSISFSNAREVFNRNSNNSASISKAKFKRNSESSVQEKDKKPTKDLENLTEKIQQFRENLDRIILEKSNNNDERTTDYTPKEPEDVLIERTEEGKQHLAPRSSNSIGKVTEEHHMSKESHSGQNTEISVQKMPKEKEPSRISLIGSYYSSDNENTDTENPQSYQDFRENELYAIPNENRVDTLSRQAKSHQLSAELHFPPPPVEAYKSIPDLIDIMKNHQEVREDDFIWQNEIYEPLDRQDLQYDEPIFTEKSKAYSKVGTVDKILGKKKVDAYDNLYEEVDDEFTFVRSPTRKEFEQRNTYVEIDDTRNKFEEQDKVGVDIENDIYGQSIKDSHIHRDPQTPKLEKTNTKFFKGKLTEDEKQIDNDLYAVPSEIFHKNNSIDTNNKDLQMENDLYSAIETNEEEVQYDNELYGECEKRPLFSRNNSRSDKLGSSKQENLSKNKNNHDEMVEVDNDLYEAVSVNNDIYAEPIINARSRGSGTELLYDEPKLEGGSVEVKTPGSVDMPLYEDPDELITRPQKSEDKLTKKKKHRKAKSEEIKKPDNFIQRMLKQATKNFEKSDKNAEFSSDAGEEALAQLAGIKDLLEKKKKELMEGMVSQRSHHRRIHSDTNAPLRYADNSRIQPVRDHTENELATPSSVDLNEEYSTVRDSKDDDEVIYSEVQRSSKELKDLIQDLLERTKKGNQGV